MKKGRVEAFTDAVVAIIMTIMVLEFHVPEVATVEGILSQLPYFIAYAVSFYFIGVAWYNHHYMFALVKRVTKKVYWLNNVWLFSMSLIPIATAWVGRFIDQRVPEYFYLAVFLIWSFAYRQLSKGIIESLNETAPDLAKKVSGMTVYRAMSSIWMIALTGVVAVLIYFYPPICLALSVIELIYMATHTNEDSDQLEGHEN